MGRDLNSKTINIDGGSKLAAALGLGGKVAIASPQSTTSDKPPDMSMTKTKSKIQSRVSDTVQ